MDEIEALAVGVLGRERRALARALSLAESVRASHHEAMTRLLVALGPASGRALRIGVTGIPGAGKSSIIDALGMHWTGRGLRVAVLAVDPSSVRSGGSILGDKLRMPRLSLDPCAFIRPIASRGASGGVAAHLDDCARLCEHAGYDVIVIETVGVGQGEVEAAALCDVLALLIVPSAGDEVQAFKRGVTEVADMVLVNKADGDLVHAASHAAREYERGIGILHGAARAPFAVRTCSALEGSGVLDVADELLHMARAQATPEKRGEKRQELFRRALERQAVASLWRQLDAWEEFPDLLTALKRSELTLRQAIERVTASGKVST